MKKIFLTALLIGLSGCFITEKEKLNYVKEHYPASYDFINSLENNQNEYTNYASEGK